MIKFSGPFYNSIEKMLPAKWVAALHNYSSGTQNIQAESNWKIVLKSYAKIAITNGIILLALLLVSVRLLIPFLNEHVEDDTTASIIGLIVSLGVAAPFIWALMAKKPDNHAYKELWLDKKYNHGPLLVLEIARILVGVLLIGFWVDRLFSTVVAILIVVPFVILVLILFSKRIQRFYQRIEGRFLTNLNARETAAAAADAASPEVFKKSSDIQSDLVPWAAHIVDLQVSQEANYLGKSLLELAWREKYGINIAYIKRGDKLIHAPGRSHKLLPFDHVGVIATDEQMLLFKPVFDTRETDIDPMPDIEDIVLQKTVVNEHTKLKGLSIRDSQIRERTNGLVVGIERNKQRILNPDSTTVFEWGDIIWVVGERKKIQSLSGGMVKKI
jgi:CPA2 family monovalent cation:H+ antiporter-2